MERLNQGEVGPAIHEKLSANFVFSFRVEELAVQETCMTTADYTVSYLKTQNTTVLRKCLTAFNSEFLFSKNLKVRRWAGLSEPMVTALHCLSRNKLSRHLIKYRQ
jgi:hypothetical protein